MVNPEWLASSWSRSQTAGLSEAKLPEDIRVSDLHLKQQRNYKSELIDAVIQCALPLFNQLFARTDSRLILTDNQGVILSSWGQPKFREKLTSIALSSGSCWQEHLKGTNAIGTALIESRPVSVIGDQHFIQKHRFISCSASPIVDYRGEVVGVLDITSEQQVHDINTQMLVQTMVQRVENQFFNTIPDGKIRVDIASERSLLDTEWQGILIADESGRVLAHNQVASQLLADGQVIGEHIDTILHRQPDETLPNFVYATKTLQKPQHRTRQISASCSLHCGDRAFEQSWQQANKVIDKDISLMILGETGVGKNEFVKALHQNSRRSHAALIAVNCGALAKGLIESELFGYAAGAFTGANSKGYQGKIRQADKGILFLDEIADLPLDAQSRLLHVLQDKTVMPVGSNQAITVDTRIVAATHKDLEVLVEKGLFRQDLYYRLNGLIITLPSLRERQDKKALIESIHRQYSDADQTLCTQLLDLLLSYSWPGNVRELDNLIKVSTLMAEGEEQLNFSHVPPHLSKALVTINDSQHCRHDQHPDVLDLRSQVDETLVKTYRANQGNISKTSRILGVSRNTLYRKLKKLGLLN